MGPRLSVCVDSLTGVESLCHDGVSTHGPVFSPHLEAALNKIIVLLQNRPPAGCTFNVDAYSSMSSDMATGPAKHAARAISRSINCAHQNWRM
jgi:hypothetical protein